MRQSFVFAAGLAALMGAVPVAGKAADKVTLRFASTTVPTSKVNVWGVAPWIKDVEKASGGTLEIKLFTGNSIATVSNVYDRTIAGVADMSFGIFGPFYDIFPQVFVAGLPFEASNCTEASVALARLYDKGLISGEFSKVKVLSLFNFGAPAINSNKPIKTVEDMQGLKIAVSGRIVGDVVTAVGGTPITMGPPDFYQAMSRGTVQGIAVGWPAIMSFKLDEVTNHHLETDAGLFPAFIFMNKRAYERLAGPAKKAVDQYSGAVFFKRMGEVTDRQNSEGRELTLKKKGQAVTQLAPTEAQRWKKLAAPIVGQWAKTTPNGPAVLAAFRQAIADIRAGK